MSVESTVRAVTTYRLTEMKQRGEKIAMLTSYDYSMARIVDAAGIDVKRNCQSSSWARIDRI